MMVLTMMLILMLLCRDFFGISSDFSVSQLMTRGNEKSSLFYVTPSLKHLIDCNQTMVNVSTVLCACLIILISVVVVAAAAAATVVVVIAVVVAVAVYSCCRFAGASELLNCCWDTIYTGWAS